MDGLGNDPRRMNVTDETDRPGGRRRGARIAVVGATLALGLGALGAAATGAFADGGDSSASGTDGAATTFVQSETTPAPQQDAPDRGDCPDGAPQQDGGSQGSSTTPS
jgi:hypothetical protein